MIDIIDYSTLRVIWWLLLGFLLMGFAIMDGFDLGAAALLRVLGQNDLERRVIINTMGPVWEGNQVWFILAGAVLFGAWPLVYALAFSGFYLALFLVLAAFILRPVSFKYRSKLSNPAWRNFWDWMLVMSGLVPAIIFGAAVGNVLQGVPFHYTLSLQSYYTGSFLALFNPFALLSGVLSLCMLLMHGACYVAVKTEAPICSRAVNIARIMAVMVILLFAIAGIWVHEAIKGYHLVTVLNPDGPSNPLQKEVVMQVGMWVKNFDQHHWMLIAPAFGFLGALFVFLLVKWSQGKYMFLFSSASVIGIIGTVGFAMFPFIMPSSTRPSHSLLVWDASSSHATLFLMLFSAVIFLPIIVMYTGWVYKVLAGKLTVADVQQNDQSLY